MKIFHIPAFTDNYIWCIQKNNKLAVVDPGDSKELLNLIKDNDLILEDILITHHHFDHTGGLEELHKLVKGNIYGPKQSNKFIILILLIFFNLIITSIYKYKFTLRFSQNE